LSAIQQGADFSNFLRIRQTVSIGQAADFPDQAKYRGIKVVNDGFEVLLLILAVFKQ
jgi:hypothetical protein